MKYILDNKSDSIKKIYVEKSEGLEIKSKNKSVAPFKTKKVLLVGVELKDAYIKQKVNKKIADLLVKMNALLESDDSSDSDISIVLGEIQRLKGIIINKYKAHLLEEEYKALLKRVILVDEEFRKKYNAIQIYRELLMESREETIGKGR